MLLISYDISNNRLRTKFAKYLRQYGGRLQLSVFEIRNSDRVLEIIMEEIQGNFEKKFQETDSIIIFELSKSCKTTKYGFAAHDDSDLLIV